MDMDTENRIVTPDLSPEDTDLEFSLRPRQLTDYIGQDKVKENLAVYIQAARGRGEKKKLLSAACGKRLPAEGGCKAGFSKSGERSRNELDLMAC